MISARPEWLKPTPIISYRKGVADAALYITNNISIRIPEPFQVSRRDLPFFAGLVAQSYGVNLQPGGRT